jgi:hypothetical protein
VGWCLRQQKELLAHLGRQALLVLAAQRLLEQALALQPRGLALGPGLQVQLVLREQELVLVRLVSLPRALAQALQERPGLALEQELPVSLVLKQLA